MQAKLLRYLTSLVLTSATVTAPLTVFSQIAWAQNREGFYCDESRDSPILVSVTNGQSIDLITFTGEWARPPYTPQNRCQTISARFQAIYLRGGNEAFNFAFGYLNNQPVMCIGAGQQGQQRRTCNPSKLLVTFQNELQACLFVPSFLEGLTRQGVQEATSNLDFSQVRQACNQKFANTGQRESTQAERDTFVALMNPSDSSSSAAPVPSTPFTNIVLQEEGVLDRSTPVLDDGSHYQIHEFQGQAGQTVAISVESSAFDPYVFLWNGSNQVIGENDDASSSDLNSLLTLTLPYTGTYRVVANALEPSGQGRYRLNIRTDQTGRGGAAQQVDNRLAANSFILWKEAALDQNSPVLESDGSSYQTYEFQGQAGQSISIELTSGAFDTYLILLNSSGEKIAENNDLSNQSSNSSLTLTLPDTGTYRVIVNAKDRSGRGSYLLTVR